VALVSEELKVLGEAPHQWATMLGLLVRFCHSIVTEYVGPPIGRLTVYEWFGNTAELRFPVAELSKIIRLGVPLNWLPRDTVPVSVVKSGGTGSEKPISPPMRRAIMPTATIARTYFL
jgi:hypothetical protein